MAKSKKRDQWEIEGDAHTLVEAELIKKDKGRFKDAVTQLTKENAARKEAIKP
ncbi:hypothetical protein LCGC14_0946750 [marine sediment metagenome]|uniref:Uncharacterized protein n=1 Tax=marine sediment metagenome TaxID=412755 RepID=A0A0F9NIL6_9ZZZZ